MLKNGLRRRFGIKLICIVFIVYIVSDADEFSIVVGAGKEDNSDAEYLRIGDSFGVGRISFEEELVYTNGYGTDEKGIELLVVFITCLLLAF